MKADSYFLHGSTPFRTLIDFVQRGLPASKAVYANHVPSTLITYKCIVVVEGNILFSQEKPSVETKMPVLNSEIYK